MTHTSCCEENVNTFSELRTVCRRCDHAQNILAVAICKPGSKVKTVGNVVKLGVNSSVKMENKYIHNVTCSFVPTEKCKPNTYLHICKVEEVDGYLENMKKVGA